jgi:hypothetical protein
MITSGMMAMKRTVVALLWIAALIVSHIRFSTSFRALQARRAV